MLNTILQNGNTPERNYIMTTKTQQIEELQAKLQQANEIINKQKEQFAKIVNKDFLLDLQETAKENPNKDFLIRNYFTKTFILTVFQEQKRIYTFKSKIEKLFFDTLYFQFQNKDAKQVFQCEYTDVTEKHIRIAICTENMSEGQIEYYNRKYNLNIPANAKMQQQYDMQEQLETDYSMF